MKRLILALLPMILSACVGPSTPSERLDLRPVPFSELRGWDKDRPAEALPPFLKSCGVFQKKKKESTLSLAQAGRVEDWQKLCKSAELIDTSDNVAARSFFEENFKAYAVQNAGPNLFTGYYEPSLRGSLKKQGSNQTPLWAKPKDMIVADLGAFKPDLKGQRITGRVEKQKFVPYDDRAKIAKGSLRGRAKTIAWAQDPVDAFFLEIQGSGRVVLDDGREIHVGYAGQNGHRYVPIGRVLAERGEIERPVTMEKIRAWLEANPKRAQEIMNENPSYVFFQKNKEKGPVGAQGVVLTPMRSLAIDPSFVPMGTPLWLETEKHQRLVVAQDTGGAIKGAVRGDLFWGHGETATQGAGEMQESGTYYLLLPKGVE